MFSISILIVFLFQLGVKTGVMIWFESNQTYIASELCENRDKPMMHCDGKCVLAKKLKQAEANQEHQTAPIQDIHNDLLPCVLDAKPAQTAQSTQTLIFHFFENLYSFIPNTYFFHPPPRLV